MTDRHIQPVHGRGLARVGNSALNRKDIRSGCGPLGIFSSSHPGLGVNDGALPALSQVRPRGTFITVSGIVLGAGPGPGPGPGVAVPACRMRVNGVAEVALWPVAV